jgi:cell division protein FtsZ
MPQTQPAAWQAPAAAPEPEPAFMSAPVQPEVQAPAPAPQPAPIAASAPPAYEPRVFEPLRAAAYPTHRAPEPEVSVDPPQQSLPLETAFTPEPVALAPPPAPIMVEVERPAPVAKIVDPSVADEHEAELIFPQSTYQDDHRNRRGGFLGFFGRQRYEPPVVQRSAPVQTMPSREDPDDADDLEIPSFLRRLAN